MSLRTLFNTTTLADRLLFLILCVLSVSGFFLMRAVLPAKETVQVDVNGKPAYIFPLGEDRTFLVRGSLGDTVVEIRGRRVRITDSPCLNNLCIRRGWIRNGSLICLPNRVAVTISGHNDPGRNTDAITR